MTGFPVMGPAAATSFLLFATSVLAAQGPHSQTASFDTSVVKPAHLRYLIDLPPAYAATEASWLLVL